MASGPCCPLRPCHSLCPSFTSLFPSRHPPRPTGPHLNFSPRALRVSLSAAPVLCVLLLSAACLPRHQVRLLRMRPLSTLHCGVSPHRERRWHIHAACTNDDSRNSQTRAGKYRVCVQGQTKAPGPGTGRLGPNPTPTTKTGCGCGQDTGLPCVLIWKVTHGSTCLVTHWAIRISTHTKCTEPKPAGSHVAHVLSCV